MPSTVIASYAYNRDTEVLTIVYTSGVIYEYFQVPDTVYDEFLGFREKGVFLNHQIKGKFRLRKVGSGPRLSHG